MGRFLHLGAAVCGVISCILVIVALASSAWITGCIPYDNIFKTAREIPDAQNNLPANFENAAELLKGTKFCIDVGIFKVKMNAANVVDVSVGADITNMPRTVLYGVFALITSVVMGVVGVILLLAATMAERDPYETVVAKRTRAAMVLLALASLAGIFGMAAYTGGTTQAASDPLMFLANVGMAAGSPFQDKLMGGQFSQGRVRRDVMAGLTPDEQRYINTFTEGLNPSYGYAYYLGWMSVGFMILSAVLTAVAKYSFVHQPYNGPSSVKA